MSTFAKRYANRDDNNGVIQQVESSDSDDFSDLERFVMERREREETAADAAATSSIATDAATASVPAASSNPFAVGDDGFISFGKAAQSDDDDNEGYDATRADDAMSDQEGSSDAASSAAEDEDEEGDGDSEPSDDDEATASDSSEDEEALATGNHKSQSPSAAAAIAARASRQLWRGLDCDVFRCSGFADHTLFNLHNRALTLRGPCAIVGLTGDCLVAGYQLRRRCVFLPSRHVHAPCTPLPRLCRDQIRAAQRHVEVERSAFAQGLQHAETNAPLRLDGADDDTALRAVITKFGRIDWLWVLRVLRRWRDDAKKRDGATDALSVVLVLSPPTTMDTLIEVPSAHASTNGKRSSATAKQKKRLDAKGLVVLDRGPLAAGQQPVALRRPPFFASHAAPVPKTKLLEDLLPSLLAAPVPAPDADMAKQATTVTVTGIPGAFSPAASAAAATTPGAATPAASSPSVSALTAAEATTALGALLKVHNPWPSMMAVGAANVGKSTMCRFFANTLLSAHGVCYWLDLDLGQGEFAPSGCIGLYRITQPLLLSQQMQRGGVSAVSVQYLGAPTIRDPEATSNAIAALCDVFIEQVLAPAKVGADKWAQLSSQQRSQKEQAAAAGRRRAREEEGAAAGTSPIMSPTSSSVASPTPAAAAADFEVVNAVQELRASRAAPLIINTHGWVLSTGRRATLEALRRLRPRAVLHIQAPRWASKQEDWTAGQGEALSAAWLQAHAPAVVFPEMALNSKVVAARFCVGGPSSSSSASTGGSSTSGGLSQLSGTDAALIHARVPFRHRLHTDRLQQALPVKDAAAHRNSVWERYFNDRYTAGALARTSAGSNDNDTAASIADGFGAGRIDLAAFSLAPFPPHSVLLPALARRLGSGKWAPRSHAVAALQCHPFVLSSPPAGNGTNAATTTAAAAGITAAVHWCCAEPPLGVAGATHAVRFLTGAASAAAAPLSADDAAALSDGSLVYMMLVPSSRIAEWRAQVAASTGVALPTLPNKGKQQQPPPFASLSTLAAVPTSVLAAALPVAFGVVRVATFKAPVAPAPAGDADDAAAAAAPMATAVATFGIHCPVALPALDVVRRAGLEWIAVSGWQQFNPAWVRVETARRMGFFFGTAPSNAGATESSASHVAPEAIDVIKLPADIWRRPQKKLQQQAQPLSMTEEEAVALDVDVSDTENDE